MFENEESGHGEVTSFGALCTALSATIGTGNIVGVATAIVAGGPGALFWMEIAALFGMATKYSEGLLAIKYRTTDKHGHILGGPFYYIENGMGKKWTWLAKIFAFFGMGVGLFGIGTFTQVNGITSAVGNFFDPNAQNVIHLLGRDYTLAVVISGLILTVCVGLVVIGGLKRIAKVSEIIVPFMAVIYIAISLLLLILNANKIPAAIVEIVSSAFGMRAAAGGALGAIIVAMQKGIARGIFSNEAGLGSAPIAAAAAQTKEPARQGLVTMTGTFIDTIVVCTMTGLSIVLTGSWNIGLEGVAVTTNAFQQGLPFAPQISAFLLMMCLVFFAFTTILGWDYYSERCLAYLSGSNHFGFRVDRFVHDPKIFCNGIHVDLGTDTAVFTAHHVSSPSCIVFCNRCFRYLHLFLSSASARTRISPSTRSFAVILRFPYFCAAASPAHPCRKTASFAASNNVIPCAVSPANTPVSTSPEPAVAMPLFPEVLM